MCRNVSLRDYCPLFIYLGLFMAHPRSLNGEIRRQFMAMPLETTTTEVDPGIGDTTQPGAGGPKNKFPRKKTTTKMLVRTTPNAVAFDDPCEFQAKFCMNVYKTGKLCGRSPYYQYYTFDNYCLLDYINCVNKWDIWEVAYMGDCINATADGNIIVDYMHYPIFNDYFMDNMYALQE